MEQLFVLAIVILVLFGVLAALKRQLSASTLQPADSPVASSGSRPPVGDAIADTHDYRVAGTLLTEVEQVVYHRLCAIHPPRYIATQVQVSRAIIPYAGVAFRSAMNRIDRKSFDFLLLRADTSPLAALEIDDSSHSRADRQRADAVKNEACRSAGLPLIRMPASPPPTVDDLRKALAGVVRATETSTSEGTSENTDFEVP